MADCLGTKLQAVPLERCAQMDALKLLHRYCCRCLVYRNFCSLGLVTSEMRWWLNWQCYSDPAWRSFTFLSSDSLLYVISTCASDSWQMQLWSECRHVVRSATFWTWMIHCTAALWHGHWSLWVLSLKCSKLRYLFCQNHWMILSFWIFLGGSTIVMAYCFMLTLLQLVW